MSRKLARSIVVDLIKYIATQKLVFEQEISLKQYAVMRKEVLNQLKTLSKNTPPSVEERLRKLEDAVFPAKNEEEKE